MKIVDLTPAEGCPEGLRPVALLRQACAGTPDGLSIGEVRERMKVLDALDAMEAAGGTVLELEDFHHATAQAAVNRSKWVAANKWILDGCDRVLEAKDKAEAKAEK